jgi:hypothetical protein
VDGHSPAGREALFIFGIPAYFAELQTVCNRGAEQLFAEDWILTPDEMREHRALGLSTGLYAAYNVALSIVFALVWWAARPSSGAGRGIA